MAAVREIVGKGLGRRKVSWDCGLMMVLRWEEPEQVMTGSAAKVSEKYLVQLGQRGEEDVELNIPRPASAH